MVKRNRLPDNTCLQGIRLMEERDITGVTDLLKSYLDQFDLAPEYTENEVRHWLLHKGDETTRVIWTYVVEVTPFSRITLMIGSIEQTTH